SRRLVAISGASSPCVNNRRLDSPVRRWAAVEVMAIAVTRRDAKLFDYSGREATWLANAMISVAAFEYRGRQPGSSSAAMAPNRTCFGGPRALSPFSTPSLFAASDRRIDAIEQQVGTSHEARGVACKIEGGAGDLLCLAETTDRMLRDSLSASVCHATVSERDALGLDGARRQRVDADVVAGVVNGHHLGELDQRALASAVDAAACSADPAHLRGDVYDATATGIGHMRDDSPAHEIGTGEIDGDGSVPVGRLEFDDGASRLAHGCAVDQGARAPVRRDCGLDCAGDARLARHVAAKRYRRAAGALDAR